MIKNREQLIGEVPVKYRPVAEHILDTLPSSLLAKSMKVKKPAKSLNGDPETLLEVVVIYRGNFARETLKFDVEKLLKDLKFKH